MIYLSNSQFGVAIQKNSRGAAMTPNEIVIDGYLKAWGYFVRVDRSRRQYSQVNWGDFVGENPVGVEDVVLSRVCDFMRVLRGGNPDVYTVLRALYVEHQSARDVARKTGRNERTVRALRQQGWQALNWYFFGRVDEVAPSRIQRWGELPLGAIV
jgi:hypothetical protein